MWNLGSKKRVVLCFLVVVLFANRVEAHAYVCLEAAVGGVVCIVCFFVSIYGAEVEVEIIFYFVGEVEVGVEDVAGVSVKHSDAFFGVSVVVIFEDISSEADV